MAIEVCAAVIFYEGKLLITSRPEGKHYAGLWEFPGGKIERGESLNSCIKRELLEELGLEVLAFDKIWMTHYSYQNKDVIINFIRCLMLSTPENIKPFDGQQLNWVAVEDLKDYNLIPADAEFCGFLLKRKDFN